MNRSTFILGSALLVVAATLAATITVRNAPPEQAATTAQPAAHALRSRTLAADATDQRPQLPRTVPSRRSSREDFSVEAPADWLATLPAVEQAELRQRVARVQQDARERLERMTEEFDLTAEQRAKMFPLLVRSTQGFDPVMRVAGGYLEPDLASADEEVHGLLDADQQAQLEDQELNRHLWWQEVVSRLEQELIDSTGGTAAEPAAEPATPTPDPEPVVEPTERVAPTGR